MSAPAAESRRTLALKADGGAVRDQHLYIERPEDDQVYELLREGTYCNILTSRQMGKTSLVMHLRTRLKAAGVRVIHVSLEGVGGNQLGDARTWYKSVLSELALRLDGSLTRFDAWWAARDDDTPMATVVRAFTYDFLLPKEGEVVVVLDEVDITRTLDFTDDLFLALRALEHERGDKPELRRVTFCLVGVLLTSDLIKAATATPYNIGATVRLSDFSRDSCDLSPLDEHLKAHALDGEALVDEVLSWTGGQPFLTIVLCDQLIRSEGLRSVADLVKAEVGNPAAFGVHFTRVEQIVSERIGKDSSVRKPYLRMLAGKRVQGVAERDEESLLLAGLVKRDSDGMLMLRNRIYRQRFNRRWVSRLLPAPPVPRWLMAVLVMLIAGIVIGVWQAKKSAERLKAQQEREQHKARLDKELTKGAATLAKAESDKEAKDIWQELRRQKSSGLKLDDPRLDKATTTYLKLATLKLSQQADQLALNGCSEEAAVLRSHLAARSGSKPYPEIPPMLQHTRRIHWLRSGPGKKKSVDEVKRCKERRRGSCERLTYEGDTLIASCGNALIEMPPDKPPSSWPGERGTHAIPLRSLGERSSVGRDGSALRIRIKETDMRLTVCKDNTPVIQHSATFVAGKLGLAYVCQDQTYGWRLIDKVSSWLNQALAGRPGWKKGYHTIATAWLGGIFVRGAPAQRGTLLTARGSRLALPFLNKLSYRSGGAVFGVFSTEEPLSIGTFKHDRKGLLLSTRIDVAKSKLSNGEELSCKGALCLFVALAAGATEHEFAGLMAGVYINKSKPPSLTDPQLLYHKNGVLRALPLDALDSQPALAIGNDEQQPVIAVAETGRVRILSITAQPAQPFEEMQRRLGLTVLYNEQAPPRIERLVDVSLQNPPPLAELFQP